MRHFTALHAVQPRLHKGVDGHVAGQVVLQHQAEQVGADAAEAVFVHGEPAFHAAAVHQRPDPGQAPRDRPQRTGHQAVDLLLRHGVVLLHEQAQHVAQGLGAFALVHLVQRQVVEAELADQPPGQLTFCKGRLRRRGWTDQADGMHRHRVGHLQVVEAVARHQPGQVTVGHQGLHREVAQRFAVRGFVLVHQAEEHLGAGVRGACAVAACAVGYQARLAPNREVPPMVAFVMVQGLVHRPKERRLGAAGQLALQFVDGEHLEVQRSRPVGHQVQLGLAGGHLQAIDPVLEQVDHRRAVQGELLGLHHAGQLSGAARQQDDDLCFAALDAGQAGRQVLQREEVKARGAGEVLVQQVVPEPAVPLQRQHALRGAQPFMHQGAIGHHMRPITHAPGLTDQAGHGARMQQLEQVRGQLLLAAQVDGQTVQALDVAERQFALHAQAQPKRPLHLHMGRQVAVGRGYVGRHPGQARLHDLQRPQHQVLCRAELAGRDLAIGQPGERRGAAAYQEALAEVAFGRLRVQLRHRHRRCGADVVGVHHLQQALGEARKLGIELDAHARRHEAERLDQPLDIGVGHLLPLHAQPARDLGVHLGKLARAFAHVEQLFVVVAQQLGMHGEVLAARAQRGRSSMRLFSRSTALCTVNSIG